MNEDEYLEKSVQFAKGTIELAFRMGYATRDDEIVRCKDCKHYYEKEWVVGGGSYTTCWYQTIANAQPNDFCSRAERKEE